MADHGASAIYEDASEDDVARANMLSNIRNGDAVQVRRLHLLARRVKRTDYNMRLDLWNVLHQIEDLGAVIVETDTGRTSSDQRQRDMMIKDAIEVLTRGHKARASKIARANGMKGGRPPLDVSATQADAETAWRDPDLTGSKLRERLRRLGWTLSRCYQVFGPRGGRT